MVLSCGICAGRDARIEVRARDCRRPACRSSLNYSSTLSRVFHAIPDECRPSRARPRRNRVARTASYAASHLSSLLITSKNLNSFNFSLSKLSSNIFDLPTVRLHRLALLTFQDGSSLSQNVLRRRVRSGAQGYSVHEASVAYDRRGHECCSSR